VGDVGWFFPVPLQLVRERVDGKRMSGSIVKTIKSTFSYRREEECGAVMRRLRPQLSGGGKGGKNGGEKAGEWERFPEKKRREHEEKEPRKQTARKTSGGEGEGPLGEGYSK